MLRLSAWIALPVPLVMRLVYPPVINVLLAHGLLLLSSLLLLNAQLVMWAITPLL